MAVVDDIMAENYELINKPIK